MYIYWLLVRVDVGPVVGSLLIAGGSLWLRTLVMRLARRRRRGCRRGNWRVPRGRRGGRGRRVRGVVEPLLEPVGSIRRRERQTVDLTTVRISPLYEDLRTTTVLHVWHQRGVESYLHDRQIKQNYKHPHWRSHRPLCGCYLFTVSNSDLLLFHVAVTGFANITSLLAQKEHFLL